MTNRKAEVSVLVERIFVSWVVVDGHTELNQTRRSKRSTCLRDFELEVKMDWRSWKKKNPRFSIKRCEAIVEVYEKLRKYAVFNKARMLDYTVADSRHLSIKLFNERQRENGEKLFNDLVLEGDLHGGSFHIQRIV